MIKIGLITGLVFCTGLAVLAACLPWVAERAIHLRFGDLMRQRDIGFKISRIGMSRAEISDLSWGKDLRIDHAKLEYDLKWSGSLLGSILPRKLRISGISVHARVDDSSHVVIQGVSGRGADKKDNSRKLSEPLGKRLNEFVSMLPPCLTLENSRVFLSLGDKPVMIPFEVRASLDKERKKADLTADAWLFGNRIQAKADLDMGKLDESAPDVDGLIQNLSMETSGFDPNRVLAFLGRSARIFLFSEDCDIRLSKKAGADWSLSLSRLNMVRPHGLGIENLTADLHLEDNRLRMETRFDLTCTDINTIRFIKPDPGSKTRQFQAIPLSGNLGLNLAGPSGWNLAVETGAFKGGTLVQGEKRIVFKQPFMALSMEGDREKIQGNVILRSAGMATDLDGKHLTAQALTLESSLEGFRGGRGSARELTLQFDFNSRVSDAGLELSGLKSLFPSVETHGVMKLDPGKRPQINGILTLVNGRASIPGPKIDCTGIHARLPFQAGQPGKIRKGEFGIEAIRTAGKPEIRLSGHMVQAAPLKLDFTGDLICPDFDDVRLQFSGSADLENQPHAQLDFSAGPFRLLADRIRTLIQKPVREVDFDLNLSGRGKITYEGHGFQTQAMLDIHDGFVSLPDMNVKASGIRTSLAFNDLIRPESLPGQILTIDSIESGKFRFKGARVRFTIEDGEFIQIENARAGWCNGLVSTESFRFPSTDGQHHLIFYCDRLELTSLLEQVGAFQARGQGTLSGRIPVSYSNGDFSFDNGFLFSTPGTGGTVQIQNTDRITAGIPVDTPQFGQLDLAREALKDFTYTWAKLNLNTIEDTLNFKMELDGQPSTLLPFEYQNDIGSFVRVKAGSPGSHFQGIKLDVNLKLPFNKFMKFGKQLKSLFKQ